MKRVRWTLAVRFVVSLIFCVSGANLSAVGERAGSPQAAPGQTPSVLGVPCSQVGDLGLEMQLNMRAAIIRIGCGIETPGVPGPASPDLAPIEPLSPTNVNTITAPENYPYVTQSESMVWSSDGQTVVVHYNDARELVSSPIIIANISVSTDGGATFTRFNPSPLRGHANNFGDPILVYNQALGEWFAGDLVSGCGAQGIGLWTSVDAQTWSVGACAHTGDADDRESMWVDNNPASPFFGRMYISWNDFVSGQRLSLTHSDDGVNWSSRVFLTAGFIRDVQLTGSPGSDGTVFVAGMNEGAMRTNLIYRSSDGGDTWTQITMGAPFNPPGQAGVPNCGGFRAIPPIWRYQGWGQPAVGPNGVVHYVYGAEGVNAGDIGDILYTQSTDNGDTWSVPIVLNTDQASGGAKEQWMPSLSVTADGQLHAHWYDRRNTTDGRNYEVFGRQSSDNGMTWNQDEAVSDVLIPQPEQVTPGIQACYAGDYNYATAFGTTHYATWTDGRNSISGHFQQDVYFAAVPAASAASFNIAADASSLTIPPDSFDVSTVTVTSVGGFSDAVTLDCDGQQPNGVTCDYSPNPVTPPPGGSATSTLTLSVGPDVPDGSYDFNLTGTNGASVRTTAFHLDVVSGARPVRAGLHRIQRRSSSSRR